MSTMAIAAPIVGSISLISITVASAAAVKTYTPVLYALSVAAGAVTLICVIATILSYLLA
jgi:hypothetical protein